MLVPGKTNIKSQLQLLRVFWFVTFSTLSYQMFPVLSLIERPCCLLGKRMTPAAGTVFDPGVFFDITDPNLFVTNPGPHVLLYKHHIWLSIMDRDRR